MGQAYLHSMKASTYKQVTYRDARYNLPAKALGGTRLAPMLKPADELLLNWAYDTAGSEKLPSVALYHDRMGVLCTCVRAQRKRFVSNDVRHHQRLLDAYERNGLGPAPNNLNLLELPTKGEPFNLLQVPKSLELFELYLRHIAATANPETKLASAFQTRHFTPRLLDIAAKYAGTVTQSRAYKKARLLLLSDFLPFTQAEVSLTKVVYENVIYSQYPGVFSADHIDYATQFLLDEWATNDYLAELPAPAEIIDCGCGNGIIGDYLLGRYPGAHLTAYDVSRVAVASTKSNLFEHGYRSNSQVFMASGLAQILTPLRFDLIVTNPPFHDEHQTDISISTDLFLEASDRLNPNGHLVVVANRHLNYATHLRRYFDEVLEVSVNEKFVIYRCR